jgi:hypothetical protein
MRKPPLETTPHPGSDYDPMDRIVQDMQNIQSFLSYLSEKHDPQYFQTHFSKILGLQRIMSQQIDLLASEPYEYASTRLGALKNKNRRVFSYLEGLAGTIDPFNAKEFKKFVTACEKELSDMDQDLTP